MGLFFMVEYDVAIGTEEIVVSIDGYTGEIRYYWLGRLLQSGPTRIIEKYAPPRVKRQLSIAKVKEIAKSYLFLNTQMELKEYKLTASYEGNLWHIEFERQLGDTRSREMPST